MTRSAPQLPCLMCGKPADDPDGLVCSGCKPVLAQRAKASRAPMNEYCSVCGRWKSLPGPGACNICKAKGLDGVHCPRCGEPKEPHSGEWCVACTAAFEPILRDHLERRKELRRQLFLRLGRDAAARFVEAIGFAFSADLSTDDKIEALAAWSEGLSTGCGISRDEATAEFARVVASRMDLFKPKEPIS
jgi:hypothetical protein